jgi:CheY-like chemotaxis protein
MEVLAATEGSTLCVKGKGARSESDTESEPANADTLALRNPLLLLSLTDRSVADTILDAAHADQIPVIEAKSEYEVLRMTVESPPSLVILERKEGTSGALELCAKIRSLPPATDVPIIIVAHAQVLQPDMAIGVTDWLIWPFSSAYARTQSSLVAADCCPVERAPLPPDEEERLATLHNLRILDTPREQRFDRLTRLAAGILGVPIALVSLVDRERQWFKSAHGVSVDQTPREISFCAHAVASRKLLVVPDTFDDNRFADNPGVTGDQRVRFYAGCPLFVQESCVGTLCVLDTRPRQLNAQQLDLLQDVAILVERELRQQPITGS